MNISINDISSLESAKEGDLSFLDNLKYLKNLNNCKASAIIIPSKVTDSFNTKAVILRSDNAYASYAKALQKFYPIKYDNKDNLIDNSLIDSNSKISDKAMIGPNVQIKSGTIIKSFSNIGPNVIIGKDCFIDSNVNIALSC